MKFLMICFIAANALATCNNKRTENLNEIILYVNSEMIACQGVGPMQCLQTQESSVIDEEKWELFYNTIKGFEYQPGYVYKLLVKKENLDPKTIPADASSIKYTLIRVLEKKKSEEFLLDDIWSVEAMNNERIDIPEILDDTKDYSLVLAIDLLEMKTLGYDGCNNFHGIIETYENNKITFKLIGATKMMCPDMKLSSNYMLALEKTKVYKIENLQLYFYDADGNELLKFQKAQ